MSDSQSPRAKRDSTNDPEAYAHGKVQTSQRGNPKSDPAIDKYENTYPRGIKQLYDLDKS